MPGACHTQYDPNQSCVSAEEIISRLKVNMNGWNISRGLFDEDTLRNPPLCSLATRADNKGRSRQAGCAVRLRLQTEEYR